MKTTLVKREGRRFDIFVQRTRREEKTVKGERDVPLAQLGEALAVMVKKTRDEA